MCGVRFHMSPVKWETINLELISEVPTDWSSLLTLPPVLFLDEYWQNHPELHEIPIYYASSLAKKCMSGNIFIL